MYIFNSFVATKDSNPIYPAYGITFFAQTNPQYQDHSSYNEPMQVPASAVLEGLDTSWEKKPCSHAFWRPAVWKQGGAEQSTKAVLSDIWCGMWIYKWRGIAYTTLISVFVSSCVTNLTFVKLFMYQHPSDLLPHLFNCPFFQPSRLLFLGSEQNGAYFHTGLVGGVAHSSIVKHPLNQDYWHAFTVEFRPWKETFLVTMDPVCVTGAGDMNRAPKCINSPFYTDIPLYCR